MILHSVLLPQPLAPSSAWISPSATLMRPLLRAITAPNRFSIPSASRASAMPIPLEEEDPRYPKVPIARKSLFEILGRLVDRQRLCHRPVPGLSFGLLHRIGKVLVCDSRDRDVNGIAVDAAEDAVLELLAH